MAAETESAAAATSVAGEGEPAGTVVDANENQNKGQEGDKGSTDLTKGAEKPTDKKEADAPVVPEKYELKLPEGVLVDETMMTEFTKFGQEQKWTNEQAQKAADMHLKAIGAFAQKQEAEHVAKIESWSKEVIADKEIGGAKIDESMVQARKVMALAATIPGVNVERLKADLNASGNATHPDLVRLFHYFGQFIGEDNQFIKGSPAGQGPKSPEEVLYGPTGVRSQT